jgi:hypothetical protein
VSGVVASNVLESSDMDVLEAGKRRLLVRDVVEYLRSDGALPSVAASAADSACCWVSVSAAQLADSMLLAL